MADANEREIDLAEKLDAQYTRESEAAETIDEAQHRCIALLARALAAYREELGAAAPAPSINEKAGARHKQLSDALVKREREYATAIDRLVELASREAENEVYDITVLLREALEMTRCLRRLVPSVSLRELHRAFGAPGDFGYETPIGDALYRLYRGEPAHAEPGAPNG